MPNPLNSLQRIVRDLTAAEDLGQMLRSLVEQTRRAMAVDVCTFYLMSRTEPYLVLMATDGMCRDVEGQLRIGTDEGLVGLVARTSELINLDDVLSHPRYSPLPNLDGTPPCHAFLGVPVVHMGRVRGVLVVRQVDRRKFDNANEAFLTTLAAQLGGALALAEATGELDRPPDSSENALGQIEGHAAASGTALGTAVQVGIRGWSGTDAGKGPSDPTSEEALFQSALTEASREIEDLIDLASGPEAAERRDILTAYLGMLQSRELTDPTLEAIAEGRSASEAWNETIAGLAARFSESSEHYLRERGRDLQHLGAEVLDRMLESSTAGIEFPERTVLVGDVGVLDFARVPEGRIVAIVCAHGSTASHVAILAGALGIPAVMGVGDLPWRRIAGRQLLVNGDRGRVYVDPSPNLIDQHDRRRHAVGKLYSHLHSLRDQPAVTADGVKISVCANTGMLGDVAPVLEVGAEGIGLYRSEYAFMRMERFPSEDEQYETYRRVLQALAPRPVTLRTLDIGADKPLPYFPVHEANPALGWRGVRVTLDHPEIFLTQVRAALRASRDLGNLRLLLPMISGVTELAACLELVRQAHSDLSTAGSTVDLPPVGVMIEVPSAVYLAPALLRRADFVSVGSNDLTQYLLAADRNNERVARLADSLHPAVLAAIDQVARAAVSAGKSAAVCGAIAGDPLAVFALLGTGIDTLSVPTARVLAVKHLVRSLSVGEARARLQEALGMETAEEVRAMYRQAIDAADLGEVATAVDGSLD